MQKFYGGDPLGWYTMPLGLLSLFLGAIPRIADGKAGSKRHRSLGEALSSLPIPVVRH